MNGHNGARPTVAEAKKISIIYVTSALVAAFLYTVSIAVITVTKSYRINIHRLLLYQAIAGLLLSVMLGLEIAPVDTDMPDNCTVDIKQGSGWKDACVLIGALNQYWGFFHQMVIDWISFYVFMLVVFQRPLKERRHEIIGICVVFFVPILFTWVPFLHDSYGLRGTVCWISDDYGKNTSYGSIFKVVVSVVPLSILTFVGLVLLTASTAVLIKAALKGGRHLRKQHWIALKEIVPLMIYPCACFIVYLLRLIVEAAYKLNPSDMVDVAFSVLFDFYSLMLLISVLMHPSIRRLLPLVLKRPNYSVALETALETTTLIEANVIANPRTDAKKVDATLVNGGEKN